MAAAPASMTEFYRNVRDGVDYWMDVERYDFKTLARLLGDAEPAHPITSASLRRKLRVEGRSSADITFELAAALACVLTNGSIDTLARPWGIQQARTAEQRYTQEVMNLICNRTNPLCIIMGRIPTYAVMPPVVAHHVHMAQFGDGSPLVETRDWLAGHIRYLFDRAEGRRRPKVRNYVSRQRFELLFSRPASSDVAAGLDLYLRNLQQVVRDPFGVKHRMFEIFLVDDRLFAPDLDSRIMWKNRLAACRLLTAPGLTSSTDDRALTDACEMEKRLQDHGHPEPLTVEKLERHRRRVNG